MNSEPIKPQLNNDSPLVTIALVTWNGDKFVHRCLEHVVEQTHRPIEVIIVDNGSTDGSLEKIKSRYPEFTYIETGENLGYARGMNRALAAARGEFIVTLNQDVCIHQDFVSRCVSRIRQDDSIGAIGGRVFAWLGDELTNIIRKGEGEYFVMKKRFQGDGGHIVDKETWTFIPEGAFVFVRRAMLQDLYETSGFYFDETYGNYWEDTDLFFRMHLRGWRCLFDPNAYGWHVGSGSEGGKRGWLGKSFRSRVFVIRNRYYTMLKNLSVPMLLWLFPYLVAAEFAIPVYLLLRSPQTLPALPIAWWDVLRSSRRLWRTRQRIQNSTKVGPLFLKQYFQRF